MDGDPPVAPLHPQSAEFFDAKYAADPDPWRFASSPSEIARFDHAIALLGDRHFARGYEPGCSIGTLTERLAPRCDHLVANDVSPLAVDQARERCARFGHVEIAVGRLQDPPPPDLDLVALCEVGYYLDAAALDDALDALAQVMRPGALLLGVHWAGFSPDHVLTGVEVHDHLDAHPELVPLACEDRPGYLAGTWTRRAT